MGAASSEDDEGSGDNLGDRKKGHTDKFKMSFQGTWQWPKKQTTSFLINSIQIGQLWSTRDHPFDDKKPRWSYSIGPHASHCFDVGSDEVYSYCNPETKFYKSLRLEYDAGRVQFIFNRPEGLVHVRRGPARVLVKDSHDHMYYFVKNPSRRVLGHLRPVDIKTQTLYITGVIMTADLMSWVGESKCPVNLMMKKFDNRFHIDFEGIDIF